MQACGLAGTPGMRLVDAAVYRRILLHAESKPGCSPQAPSDRTACGSKRPQPYTTTHKHIMPERHTREVRVGVTGAKQPLGCDAHPHTLRIPRQAGDPSSTAQCQDGHD